ncbi:MAG: spermidine synthase [Verrucomicrobiales bacterium]
MRQIEKVRTAFQKLAVWGTEHEREFRVAGATHAWWHRDQLLSGLAWDNIAAAALLRAAGPPQSLLMLGLAGGTSLRILRHLLPELQITAVEIDRQIVELADRHMNLAELGLKVHFADAYQWLRGNTGRFDVVVDDVYGVTAEDVARPGAYDSGTRDALLGSVASEGLLVVNLVTGRGHRQLQSSFRRFFRLNFPSASSVSTPAGANEALVGGGEIRNARALAEWTAKFPQASDRWLWKKIRVQRLR